MTALLASGPLTEVAFVCLTSPMQAWMSAGVAIAATFKKLPGGQLMIEMPALTEKEGWYTFSSLDESMQRASAGKVVELIQRAHAIESKDR
jgi:hypothetical protein